MCSTRSRGTTLIETVAALLILGIASAVAIGSISSSLPELPASRQPVLARELARDLLDEILSKPFDSSSHGTTRATFADVDDYSGYTDTPPTFPNGTAIPGGAGFSRTVNVVPVGTSAPGGGAVSRSGATLLRVEVTVTWNGKSITLSGLKAQTQPGIIPGSKTGLVYVGPRRDTGQRMEALVKNRSSGDITVLSARVYWNPKDVFFYRDLTLVGVSGTDDANVNYDNAYSAAGDSMAITPSVTIPAGGTMYVALEHFKTVQSGNGPATHPDPYDFIFEFGAAGGTSYEVDVPSPHKLGGPPIYGGGH